MYMTGSGSFGAGVGDFWDDLQRAAQRVGKVAGTVSDIRAGDKQVAVLPTYQGVQQGVQQAAATIPWGLIALGAAAFLLLRRR